MIKSFIRKLIGQPKAAKTSFGQRAVVPATVHGINPDWVDERALSVVRGLKSRGFEAYIVGAPAATERKTPAARPAAPLRTSHSGTSPVQALAWKR